MTSDSLRKQADAQLEVMRDGAEECFGGEELRERLMEALRDGRPLRVKLGMDPSAPDLHLGHTVVLNKLRRFQELGHMPIFLIGDFTARIGDPSGRKKTRPALGEDAVRENASTYVKQVSKILDIERGEVRFNSEWMNAFTPSDFIRLCSHYTVARLLERDDFAKRFKEGVPISVHEFLYPFVQAYDSVALRADVELGGTDQTFNLLMAREIQRDYGQPPQAVITHTLLVGTDGREKMSKSLGNSIGISEEPKEMYAKVMSISDEQMHDYVRLLASGEWDALATGLAALGSGDGNPMELKHELAHHIVARFHDAAAANDSAERFRREVQGKAIPEDLAESRLALAGSQDLGLLEILERLGLVASRSEARRLISQGAVQLDGERVAEATARIGPGDYLIKVGKRRFARLQLQD